MALKRPTTTVVLALSVGLFALGGVGAAVLRSFDGNAPSLAVQAGGRPGDDGERLPEPTTTTTTTEPSSPSSSVTSSSTTTTAVKATVTTTKSRPTTTTAPTTTTTGPVCAAPGPFGPYVMGLTTIDGRQGLVGGNRTVRITDDGGVTWTVACLPDGMGGSVRGLTIRGERAWAVAGSLAEPVMLRSTNGGHTWQASPMPTKGLALSDLTFVDDDHGWIVGTRPAGGTNNPILGGGAAVFRTSDGGATWQTAHDFQPDQASRLVRVAFVNRTHGVAFGQNQTGQAVLLATTDAGTSWTPRTAPEGIGEVRDLVFVDPQRAWILGITYQDNPDGTRPTVSLVMASDDGGFTWTEQWRTVGMNAFDLDFTDARTGHLIADAEASSWLVSTSDGGATWNKAAVPGRALTVIDFADATHGWAGGMQGACLRVTSDGGASWTSALIEGLPTQCQS